MFSLKTCSRIFNPMYKPITKIRHKKIRKIADKSGGTIIPFHHYLLSPPNLKTFGETENA